MEGKPSGKYIRPMSKIYISRRLRAGDRTITEGELIQAAGAIVVLAEPGAGKTVLLESLARQHGITAVRASRFQHVPSMPESSVLVIDALDEVAKLDRAATSAIIEKACSGNAAMVIFASRSSEWDEAQTRYVEDCCGFEPKIVRLHPFDEHEQRQLFDAELPGENFDAFQGEVSRFDLAPLLGNPQFLILFAKAYIQRGRCFSSKNLIFSDAVERLASETGISIVARQRPTTARIIAYAEEIFAKLLLSGSTGLSVIERVQDEGYPYSRSLFENDPPELEHVLSTGLFKAASDANQHEPIHRIVAEYCAAHYLTRRIADGADRLSLRRCLALIAPNGVVREELRGLLGWMAALGNQTMQDAALALDPYAILANGDPSLLTASSKHNLLERLRQLSQIDPYFRRTDSWRRFSVSGFFNVEVVEDLRSLLAGNGHPSHLRGLLLELIAGSEAANDLDRELRTILLDANAEYTERILAYRCLSATPTFDGQATFGALVLEQSPASLRAAAEMVENLGIPYFGEEAVLSLLRALISLYPENEQRRNRLIMSRYFIKELVGSFDLNSTGFLLDALTAGLSCSCGAKHDYTCHCRDGISKICGMLLDRYFELLTGPHDPARVWQWTRNLIFHGNRPVSDSRAVKALREDNALRQAIHRLALGGLTERSVVNDTARLFYMGYRHAGLHFANNDLRALADYAYSSGNLELWLCVRPAHNIYSQQREPNELRAHMRSQARCSSVFLRAWMLAERQWKEAMFAQREHWPRSNRRYMRREEEAKDKRFEYLRANRQQIESGTHWWWIDRFSSHYLFQPDKLDEITDSVDTLETALRNSIPFLMNHLPSLADLSRGEGTHIARALHAACLVHFRKNGSLGHIDPQVLRAVKTDAGGYEGFREGEAARFEEEINRQIFRTDGDIETFAREFLEPAISDAGERHANVSWLAYKEEFRPLLKMLPLEWMQRFPDVNLETLRSLFDFAAEHGDRAKLNGLIERRYADLPPVEAGEPENIEAQRKFWRLRHFFFLDEGTDEVWAELSRDNDAIFAIENKAGALSRSDAAGWPQLSAEKIFRILGRYVDTWPAVPLPNSWGTGDPPGERAYRFLVDIVWHIGRDDPAKSVIVFDRLLADPRFARFHHHMLSLKAAAERKRALQTYEPPKPQSVVGLLDGNRIATVEDLRALMLEELGNVQVWLKGADTDPLATLYPGGKRVDENTARNRIVDWLRERLLPHNAGLVIEHQMASGNRCDITAAIMIGGKRHLVVTEVKGQWHSELFSAASAQLDQRYAIHPDASRQGIYLVLWFGGREKIAGRSRQTINTPEALRTEILNQMPRELHGLVDVFVLDLSHSKVLATT